MGCRHMYNESAPLEVQRASWSPDLNRWRSGIPRSFSLPPLKTIHSSKDDDRNAKEHQRDKTDSNLWLMVGHMVHRAQQRVDRALRYSIPRCDTGIEESTAVEVAVQVSNNIERRIGVLRVDDQQEHHGT